MTRSTKATNRADINFEIAQLPGAPLRNRTVDLLLTIDNREVPQPLVRELTSRNASSHQRSLAPDRRSRARVATQSATHFDLDLAASRKRPIQTRRPSPRDNPSPPGQQTSSARQPSPVGPCPHRRNLATGTAPVETAQGQSSANCTRSWRIEDVALVHSYAQISMIIRDRESRRRYQAERLAQSRSSQTDSEWVISWLISCAPAARSPAYACPSQCDAIGRHGPKRWRAPADSRG